MSKLVNDQERQIRAQNAAAELLERELRKPSVRRFIHEVFKLPEDTPLEMQKLLGKLH